jgi:hypothetical protein
MATARQSQPAECQLTDREFEDLLQKAWELIQVQKQQVVVFEPTESLSWT